MTSVPNPLAAPEPDGPDVPRLVVLTDREQTRRSLRVTVLEVAAAGAPAVLLREEDLDRDRRRRLGTQLSAVTGGLGTALLVAGDPELAADVGSGVLLAAEDAPVPEELRPQLLVGRSCHDEEQLRAAVDEGVDYVTVPPADDAAALAELVAAAEGLPVLLLGPVTPADAAACLEVGAHGVAVTGTVMAAKEPAEVVSELLAALDEAVG